jgi:hypothetical protein
MSAMASHGGFWMPEGWLESAIERSDDPYLSALRFGAAKIPPADLPEAIAVCSEAFGRVVDDDVRFQLTKLVDGMRLALDAGEMFDVS